MSHILSTSFYIIILDLFLACNVWVFPKMGGTPKWKVYKGKSS